MKQVMKIGIAFLFLVVLLAMASHLTTSIMWDGGFPSGEFRVLVRDPENNPVRGAVLRVYHGRTRDLAFEYPLDNHVTEQGLVSDDSGRIIAIRTYGGLQFGGHAWRLFWLIPMGAKSPRFDCEITAEGFTTLRFPVQRLFESPHRYYDDFPKTTLEENGEQVELPVYTHAFNLERQFASK